MKFGLFSLVAGVMLAGLAAVPAGQPVPVIYSTDLMHPHDDPDDHFDLACLYSIPEADVRAIILDQGQPQSQRPGHVPVWQLNHLSKRHIPAAIGLPEKLRAPHDPALNQAAAHQNGVNLILQALENSREKVAILFVGSARDIAAAFNREPALFHKKARSITGFIGEASDPKNLEYNVQLDPQAYICLLRSGLPFNWVPCFDGGLWKNNGHASFWKIRQRQVLEGTSEPLQRYFSYMLQSSTNDPIQSLALPLDPTDRAAMMDGERNLWASAVLGIPLGRPMKLEGRTVAHFAPVELWVDDQAVIHYGKGPGSRRIMRFEITDPVKFPQVATKLTADLLRAFPLRQ